MKILLVYNSEILPFERLKCYASLKKYSEDNVDVLFTLNAHTIKRNLVDKFFNFIKLPLDKFSINKRIIEKAKENKPYLVFVVKGVNIYPKTLKQLKSMGIKIVAWSNDDMYVWHNRTFFYTWGLKYYDLVVTQKSYNCNNNELPSLGAKHVLFQDKSYDPAFHFPSNECANLSDSYDVIFVGACEQQRLDSIIYLANKGIEINIFGWGRIMPIDFHPKIVFHNYHLYGEDYRRVFTHSKICLNFLRKINRDLQTSRSIEIPACRGFMIAEYSIEHARLFIENTEAVFFHSNEDLYLKVSYYLQKEIERKTIAENGYNRCIQSGYSFDARMKEILETIK